jgi:hypothetical protein
MYALIIQCILNGSIVDNAHITKLASNNYYEYLFSISANSKRIFYTLNSQHKHMEWIKRMYSYLYIYIFKLGKVKRF